jgi:hypothetical protein
VEAVPLFASMKPATAGIKFLLFHRWFSDMHTTFFLFDTVSKFKAIFQIIPLSLFLT